MSERVQARSLSRSAVWPSAKGLLQGYNLAILGKPGKRASLFAFHLGDVRSPSWAICLSAIALECGERLTMVSSVAL